MSAIAVTALLVRGLILFLICDRGPYPHPLCWHEKGRGIFIVKIPLAIFILNFDSRCLFIRHIKNPNPEFFNS